MTTAVRELAGTPFLRKSSLGKRCGRRKLVSSCWMTLSATSLAGSSASRTSPTQAGRASAPPIQRTAASPAAVPSIALPPSARPGYRRAARSRRSPMAGR